MKRINRLSELKELARELGLRHDWHEPDESGVTIRIEGVSFDNAGFWPTQEVSEDVREFITEQHVVIVQDGVSIAAVNLATLFAWACAQGEVL